MSAMRIEVQSKDFFRLPPKKVEIEEVPETGRIYFIHAGRIVAVGKPTTAGAQPWNCT